MKPCTNKDPFGRLGTLFLLLAAVGCREEPSNPAPALAPAPLSGPSPDSPYEKAIADEFRVATEAVASDPNSAEALAKRGRAHVRSNRLPEALADFNQALKLPPKLAAALAGRAECLLYQGDTGQARIDSDEAVALDPASVEAHLARALVRLAANDRPGALEACNRAVLLNPLTARAYLVRAVVQRNADRDRAMADLNDSIRLDGLRVPAYVERGLQFALRREMDRAVADWRRAADLYPACGSAHIALGVAAWRGGDNETGIAELATGLSCDNADAGWTAAGLKYVAHAYNSRACSYMRDGDCRRAEVDLLESVRLYPEADLSHVNLARIYCDEGRYAEAVGHLDAATRIDKALGPEVRAEIQKMRSEAARMTHRPADGENPIGPSPAAPVAPANPGPGTAGATSGAGAPDAAGPGLSTGSARGTFQSIADAVFTKENVMLAVEVGLAAWSEHRRRPPTVHVDGYWRDGAFIRPHERSRPRR